MAENYKLSQDYEIIPPQKQRSYPISTTEWTIIKKKILEVKDNANFWHTLGSILIGVSLSTLIAALINDFKTEKLLWTCWAAFFVTGISGGLSFHFGRAQRQTQSKSKEDVIDFMTIVEDRFQNPIQTTAHTAQTVNQSIIIHSAKYQHDKNYIEVTEKIRELVANGTTEITATNDLMGGDPYWGQQKNLVINYSINGQRKNLKIVEGATHKLD